MKTTHVRVRAHKNWERTWDNAKLLNCISVSLVGVINETVRWQMQATHSTRPLGAALLADFLLAVPFLRLEEIRRPWAKACWVKRCLALFSLI